MGERVVPSEELNRQGRAKTSSTVEQNCQNQDLQDFGIYLIFTLLLIL
ncbi:MAG: hypothetical protein JJT94_09775 [Bernardetiaceae bacterium]|nr:hypothetical protein [Bernardetiaceae bacterium]